jgi:methylated-DNA-[protein]-cysteine S-methyltransferase
MGHIRPPLDFAVTLSLSLSLSSKYSIIIQHTRTAFKSHLSLVRCHFPAATPSPLNNQHCLQATNTEISLKALPVILVALYMLKMAVTEFQEVSLLSSFRDCRIQLTAQQRVYALLVQIPAGKITSYATLARVLNTSPRAIGGALRNNPFAPEVPCHRVIAADGYVGGFKGDWEKAPSGINQTMKLELLKGEGVEFDGQGRLLTGGGKGGTAWYDGPWKL